MRDSDGSPMFKDDNGFLTNLVLAHSKGPYRTPGCIGIHTIIVSIHAFT